MRMKNGYIDNDIYSTDGNLIKKLQVHFFVCASSRIRTTSITKTTTT